MSIKLLGLLTSKQEQKEYNISNEKTSHFIRDRGGRWMLVNLDSVPLYYFEVYHTKTMSRQIHCLLEDSSIIVFNKNNNKIITVLLSTPSELDKYLKRVETCEPDTLRKLYKCAKLNKVSKADKLNKSEGFSEKELNQYIAKKSNIIERG